MKKVAKYLRYLPVIALVLALAIPVQANSLKTDCQPGSKSKAVHNFDDCNTGNIAKGWTNVYGKWEVKQDGQNRVLAQTAKNSGQDFNIAVLDAVTVKDVEMTVEARANSGSEDQGGGLVWRYIDKENYYITRFNPLEDNFRLYKVVKGRRIELKSATVTIPEGAWFKIKVVMTGTQINCYLDGKKLLSKSDDTFPKAGKTGFWTKADAVTDFDNFKLSGE